MIYSIQKCLSITQMISVCVCVSSDSSDGLYVKDDEPMKKSCCFYYNCHPVFEQRETCVRSVHFCYENCYQLIFMYLFVSASCLKVGGGNYDWRLDYDDDASVGV